MPATKTAKLHFRYYRCYYMKGDETANIAYDLSPFLEYVESESLENRIQDIRGVKGRIEERLKFAHHPGVSVMRFMRLDENSDAYKVRLDAAAEHIDLDPDEYLGKSTLVLYDAQNSVLMVQSNQGGFSYNNIMGYINAFPFVEEKCCLVKLMDSQALEEILRNGGRVTRLNASFADVRACSASGSAEFERMQAFATDLGSVTANFTLGMGYSRSECMNSNKVLSFIRAIGQNIGFVRKARVRINREDEHQTIFTEEYDIIPDIIRSEIDVPLNARKELNFQETANKMVLKYRETMGRLNTPW